MRPRRGFLTYDNQIKGNVIMVSHMANSIKNQATPDQIQKVATFYEKLYKEKGINYG